MSSNDTYAAPLVARRPRKYGVIPLIHSQPMLRYGRDAQGRPVICNRNTQEMSARNERPVRGDNRTGQAIWALGVDGRSRRIQPRWGGITAPTYVGRRRVAARSNRPCDFFLLLGRNFWTKNYCA